MSLQNMSPIQSMEIVIRSLILDTILYYQITEMTCLSWIPCEQLLLEYFVNESCLSKICTFFVNLGMKRKQSFEYIPFMERTTLKWLPVIYFMVSLHICFSVSIRTYYEYMFYIRIIYFTFFLDSFHIFHVCTVMVKLLPSYIFLIFVHASGLFFI